MCIVLKHIINIHKWVIHIDFYCLRLWETDKIIKKQTFELYWKFFYFYYIIYYFYYIILLYVLLYLL